MQDTYYRLAGSQKFIFRAVMLVALLLRTVMATVCESRLVMGSRGHRQITGTQNAPMTRWAAEFNDFCCAGGELATGRHKLWFKDGAYRYLDTSFWSTNNWTDHVFSNPALTKICWKSQSGNPYTSKFEVYDASGNRYTYPNGHYVGCGNSHQITRPPIGAEVTHGGAIIDGITLILNDCPCVFDYFTNPGFQSAVLNEALVVNLQASSSILYSDWDYYQTAYNVCGINFSIVSDPSGSISISGSTMTIYTTDSSKVGTHTVSVKATTKDGSNYSATQIFQVEIKGCVASAIQQITAPSVMTTPVYGNVYQDLAPLYTHSLLVQGKLAPADCIIGFEIVGGDTTFLKLTDGTVLHEHPYIPTDAGTYSITIKAYYVQHIDAVYPNVELTSAITVVVEPQCDITSFVNNPAISTNLNIDYEIGSPLASYPFEIAFEPAHCNFEKSYVIKIDGFEASPSWMSISTATDPPQLHIFTTNVAYDGIYSVQVESSLNTTPAIVSTVAYEFVVILQANLCSQVNFDSQTIAINFEIDYDASASTLTFPQFTYPWVGQDCGLSTYELVYTPLTGLSLNINTRTFTFSTTEPAEVGVHEAQLWVGLASYPQFNPVLHLLQPVYITVTAACWNAVMQYTSVSLVHKVRTPAITYQLPTISDDISIANDPSDGDGYCGARTYQDISLTRVDLATADSAISFFDGTDTYTLEGTLNEQFGHYVITFGVTLDLYPDFVRQDLTFNLELVPDCATSLIQDQGNEITFSPLLTGLMSEQSYNGFYTHEYEGVYADYCGPLEYILDPSGVTQNYLSHDSVNEKLLLHPISGHPSGIQNHILRVQLQNYPSAFLDVAFIVELIPCDILEFNSDIIGSQEIENITGQADSLEFGFNDFVTAQGTDCAMSYDQQYSLACTSGCADPNVQPDWITFDPTQPQFTIQSQDLANVGHYTLTISSKIELNPTDRNSDTMAEFNLEILENPCFATTILTSPLSDLDFVIAHDSTPTVAFFTPFTDAVTSAGNYDCGPIAYTLTGDAPIGVVTIDSDAESISAYSSSGLDMGTYTMTLEAQLKDYPALTQLKVSEQFQVTIDSVCTQTLLLIASQKNKVSYYQKTQGTLQQPTKVDVTFVDTVSGWAGNDGVTLCGKRTYELSYTSLGGTDTREAVLVGDDYTKQLWYSDTSQIDLNYKSTVTIKASLQEYPQVNAASYSFDIFFVRRCSEQQLISAYYFKDLTVVAIIGQQKSELLPQYYHALDAFFSLHDAESLMNAKVCGEIQSELIEINADKTPVINPEPYAWNKGVILDKISGRFSFVLNPTLESEAGQYFFIRNVFSIQHSTGDISTAWPTTIIVNIPTADELAKNKPPKIIDIDFQGKKKNSQGCIIWPSLDKMSITLTAQDSVDIDEKGEITNKNESSLRLKLQIDSKHVCEPKICFDGDGIQKVQQVDEDTLQWSIHMSIQPKDEWRGTSLDGSLGIGDGTNPDVLEEFKIFILGGSNDQSHPCLQKREQEVIEIEQIIEAEEEVIEEEVVEVEPDLSFLDKFWIKHKAKLQEGDLDLCNNPGQFAQFKDFLYRFFDHPYPLQRCFSNEGELEIYFSRPLQLPAEESMQSYMRSLVEDEALTLTVLETSYSEDTVGRPRELEPPQELEPLKELNSTDERRQLQVLVANRSSKDKNFQVHVKELTEERMVLQVTFDNPSDISPDFKDKVRVQFQTPAQFLIGSDKASASEDLEVYLMVKIPQQKLPDAITTALEVGAAVALMNVVFSAFQSSSLQMMWGSIHALQLTVHIPIHFGNEVLPSAAMQVFSILITVVTFDVLETLGEVDKGLEYEVSPTEPYSLGFEELGYDSREPVGLLGTINFLVALVILRGFFNLIKMLFICKQCRSQQNGTSRWQEYSNGVIRFMIEVTFELLIMFGLVFYNGNDDDTDRLTDLDDEERVDLDYFFIQYAAALGGLAFAFLIFTVITTLLYCKSTVNISQKIQRLEHAKALTGNDVSADPRIKRQNRKKLEILKEVRQEREERFAHCSELFNGLVPHSKSAQFYHTVYLFRRFFLMFVACRYNQMPQIQLLLVALVSLTNQIYLAQESVFEDKSQWRVEVFNDFVVLLVVLHANVIIVIQPSPEQEEAIPTVFTQWNNAGISLASIVVLNLLLNQSRVMVGLCKTGKAKFKRWYLTNKLKSKEWDRGKVMCQCKCYSCGHGRELSEMAFDPTLKLELQLVVCEFQINTLYDQGQTGRKAVHNDKRVTPKSPNESGLLDASDQFYQEKGAVSMGVRPKMTIAQRSLEETAKFDQSMLDDTYSQLELYDMSVIKEEPISAKDESLLLSDSSISQHDQSIDQSQSENDEQASSKKTLRYRDWMRSYESSRNFDQEHITNRQVKVQEMLERVGYNLETMSDNFQGEAQEVSGLDELAGPIRYENPEQPFTKQEDGKVLFAVKLGAEELKEELDGIQDRLAAFRHFD